MKQKNKKDACEYMKSQGEWKKGLEENISYTTTWFATTCKYTIYALYIHHIYTIYDITLTSYTCVWQCIYTYHTNNQNMVTIVTPLLGKCGVVH